MSNRRDLAARLGLNTGERKTLARLKTPELIQDFVAALPANFERKGGTCLSVRGALHARHGHCIEAAFIAATALWLNGERPLVMDFQASREDDDHIVALFKRDGCWGAISKSNHVWLRWRDPIYRNLRELAMSYFHEYTRFDRKTLRTYSRPVDLRRFDPALWITNEDDCWDVAGALDDAPHYRLITPAQARRLRKRDAVEMRANNLRQYKAPDRASAERY
ncbi:MAG: hypothetical protein K0S54_756 [Alphaproteobacteria bacterium]|jgi:hypothetical protein|nr:hypothetical protein [Alphaproteobacteria bacterium]